MHGTKKLYAAAVPFSEIKSGAGRKRASGKGGYSVRQLGLHIERRFPGEAVPFPVSGNDGVLFVAFSQEVALPLRKISLFFFGKTS